MSAELVTVVVPTLNRAATLRRALESVVAQTHEELEVLILDDGSNDATAALVAAHTDRRVRLISHPCRIGFVANWTFGVRLARGEYISILGDDDHYDETFLSSRLEAFRKWPEAVAVTGAFRMQREDEDLGSLSRRPAEVARAFSGPDLGKLALGVSGEWFNGATLYRKTVLQAVWDEASMGGTALDWAVHILLASQKDAKVVYLPDPEITLTVHPGQESVANREWLAKCCAASALQLWYSGTNVGRGRLGRIMREGLAKQVGHYARWLWDQGRVEEARRLFLAELSINPRDAVTWLRYGRTLARWTWPKPGRGS